MAIPVTHDQDDADGIAERCCFCRDKTRYWFLPKDVAVCPECAKYATAEDVPNKMDWCNRERIAMRTKGEYTIGSPLPNRIVFPR